MSRQDLQTVIVNRGALEADVENAKAALELAQIDLQNTRIMPRATASSARLPCVSGRT